MIWKFCFFFVSLQIVKNVFESISKHYENLQIFSCVCSCVDCLGS